MGRCKEGMLARSVAGHDAGKVYMIVRADGEYVYLADGRIRTLDRLKKKKEKHIQLICEQYDVSEVTDVKIKHILKNRNKEEE